MSALGQKQTCAAQKGMSALPPKADIEGVECDVRFVPIADIEAGCELFTLGAGFRAAISSRNRAATQSKVRKESPANVGANALPL